MEGSCIKAAMASGQLATYASAMRIPTTACISTAFSKQMSFQTRLNRYSFTGTGSSLCRTNFCKPIVRRETCFNKPLFSSKQIVSVLSPTEEQTSLGLPRQDETEDFGSLIRRDFPILHQEVNEKPLVYFDSAATSQKPTCVLAAMQEYYEEYNSNVHRGVHALSARATDQYEAAREKVARFIKAPSSRQVIFTRNASEAINLVAFTWGLANLKRGDEVVLSVAEHHSNLVPWQMLAQRTGAILRFGTLGKDEALDVQHLYTLIGRRTRMVALHHVSNTLGSMIPAAEVAERAHHFGAKLLLDACQSVPHMPVDVTALNADFVAASAHKMCGPTGIGFLYGRQELLEAMPPFMGGGEMISEVHLDYSTYAQPPSRFEAGTPAIAEAIGLGAAVDYLEGLGMDRVHQYERELTAYLYARLAAVPRVRIYGPPPAEDGSGRAASLCSFNVEGIHATDLSTFLDQQHGIAVRSGHHCTQPLHRQLGVGASARASLYLYNTRSEVDTFIEGLMDTIDFFTSFSQP